MKYLPALAALLSLAACALWIAALAGPWYHTSNPDGTEQHMGLYSSCESGHKHGHNDLEDAMGVTAFREELAQRQHHKHDNDDEEDDHSERHHHHKHKHKHEHEKEDMEKESHEMEVTLPTLQPIIIQPTVPPLNINAPTIAAPLPPQPTGPGDLQTGGGGSGGFGGWGGGGGGGFMRPTPGPTALPAHRVSPAPTPSPASKHGHAYHDHDDEDEDGHEKYESMSLNQVSAADGGGSGSRGQDDTLPHEHKRPPADVDEDEEEHAGGKHQHGNKHGDSKHGKNHGKKHQDKQEMSGNNEFPYEETWVKALRLLLMLAIIVSGIASLLQLLMAWNVGRALHKGSWTTSPTTAMITTALITLAGIHGLIVLFLFLSRRDELPHGHFDYGYTLNIVATALSLMSPILFWYTLDTSPTESLLGEETSSGGRRKYASVE